jgi:hypothetical protein
LVAKRSETLGWVFMNHAYRDKKLSVITMRFRALPAWKQD